MRHRLSVVAALLVAANAPAQQPPPPQPAFTFQEVMIPVRDGVHLQTAILTPTDKTGPLPILLRRTPYGVPDGPLPTVPTSLRELARDGYIFVFQNLRGRFKSEGVFGLTSQVNLADSTSTNETTDAYDSIDWLVKHVPNNGNVGMFGVSYDGLTTALALLHPHPALKAMSEQAAPVDQWMNDDMHRYGALHRVLERITLAQRPVAMHVVVHPLVHGRRLLAHRFEGRVGVEQRQGGGESVIRHAEHADVAVVGDVLDEPVDAVVGVRGFVRGGRVA